MAIKRDKILKTAEKLVQKGKLEPAIREFEKLLQLAPDDTNTVNRLGDLYGRVGEVDKAVALYERVAEKFADQGFLPKAIAIYKKINRLVPQRLDIFERLGELYAEQGLKVEAKNQFQMLVEHYVKNDDIEGAIRVSQRLSDIDPRDLSVIVKFADLLLEQGASEPAMEAYGDLGEKLLARGQLDEAERLYRRLLEREIPHGEIMLPICGRLLDAGRVTSAQELLTAGLEVAPESTGLQTLQVRTSMALGDTERAVELAREVLEKDPENTDVRSLVGNVLISEGDQQEAAEMMIPAAEALLEKADYSRAQQMLRELVKTAPGDERILRLAVRAFRPSGDQEMITTLTASLAEVCFETGQEDQARRLFMELVATDPTNEQYRKRLAQLDGATITDDEPDAGVMELGEIDDGVPPDISFPSDDEVEIIDMDDEAPAPDAAFDPSERISEAAVFIKYGLNEKAVAHLEDVIGRVPDHVEARETLARLYVTIGQRADAARTIEPVVAHHRAAGRDDEASRLTEEYGLAPGIEDEDSAVIIVDLDDEAGDVAGDSAPMSAPGSLPDVDDLVAEAVRSQTTDSPRIEAEPELPQPAEPVELEPEVVEEELVEISSGVDGPSQSELAQLDLFIEQELLDDAVTILDRLDKEYPGDADLAERRTRLVDSLAAANAGGSAAPPSEPQPPIEPPAPVPPAEPEPVEEYIDLAKELEAELAEEEAMVEEATGRGKGEALLDEVFKEFQRGVAEQLSEDDSDTHFNLGIAYKEMGLLEQAIGEFQVAAHDPEFFVEACSMIGVCANEVGNHAEAAEWYQKALVAPDLSPDARAALRYELALAFEKTGDLEQAAGLFEQIAASDPGYRDVAARLASLSEQQRQIN
ncbi:MAG: tetratricopeptide repeat protein [Holophagae bacterium]|jgi:tetratricopeptide (TPR) repeat protein